MAEVTPKAPTKRATTPLQTQADSIRAQPSDADLAAKREATKPEKPSRVEVMTTHGSDMWDPDSSRWIEGQACLVPMTDWLKRQIEAKKIKLAE